MSRCSWRSCGRSSVLAAFLAFAFVSFPIGRGAAETGPFQSQAEFEVAIRDDSTSPYLILLTVVDDRTGQSWTDCTLAPFLVGAIWMEQDPQRNGAPIEEHDRIALAHTSRVFHFFQQSALDILPTVRDGTYRQACEVIKSGGCMRMIDRASMFISCGNTGLLRPRRDGADIRNCSRAAIFAAAPTSTSRRNADQHVATCGSALGGCSPVLRVAGKPAIGLPTTALMEAAMFTAVRFPGPMRDT
jgi:hypothetical protein